MLSAKVICVFAFWLAGCSTTHGVARNLESELSRVSQDVSTYPYNKDFKTCPISMDIAYLIDGSDSISPSEFDLEKTVVKVMAYFFGVMRLGTHNGVVVFSDTARTAIKFSDHEKFEPFRQAVKALVKPSGGTRIDVALEEAHDNLFMGGGGARASPDIPKVAVVFTDGVSGGQSLGTAVQQLRNKGILVFAVGINTDPTQIAGLRQLVPRSDLFFTARDFLDLYIRAGFISRLICQHIQNRGAPGPAGVQGTDGPPGLTGSPGAPGPVGDKGSMGPQGPKGLKGRKGATGDSGRPGTPGEDGFPGPTGPKGPDGQPGEPGAPGPRGPTGDTGNDGDPGPRGPKGFPGATGIKGDPGPNGANGSPGADGSDGAKGQQGLPGDIGASGPPGIDGTNGAPGSKGQPGNNGANGRPGPSGPAGPKGDPGPRGPDGNAGPVGDPGPAGQNGDNGVNGDPGNDGAPGPRGPTGPAGPKGFKGTSGDNGLNGFNGPVGPKGLPGGPGRDASQSITCMFRQSATGQLSMSCNDLSYTATDCSCSRGCGQWRVTDNGQTCRCLCNTYVPSSLYSVGVNCCKLQ